MSPVPDSPETKAARGPRHPRDGMREGWRGGWWKAGLAVGACGILVGLPDARLYSDPGWAPVLALVTLAGVAVTWWASRKGPSRPVSVWEAVGVGAAGAALTVLFWVRAHLGVPGVILGDVPLRLTARLGGWAWPALLLVVLYRRGGEGLRVAGARRAGLLLAMGLVAGSVGFVAHYPVLGLVEDRPGVVRFLERPLASSPALALGGGPREMTVDPAGVVFNLASPRGHQVREVVVSGGLLPGVAGDVSRAWQGTRLESGDGRVVAVEVDEEGRWRMSPRDPGGAVVIVQNRRARAWIGVWVVEEGRISPGPPEDVTGQVQVEAGPLRPPEDGFAHRQALTVRNDSPEPILGPLHLVLRLPASGPAFVGGARTVDPTVLEAFDPRQEHLSAIPDGLPWVEVLPGPRFPRTPAPVLAPGQSASVDVLVTGAIDLEDPGTVVRVFRSLHGL